MAVDPQTSTGSALSPVSSPIENELPTYRAVSPLAITSMLLGLVASLTFVSHWFLVAGGLAVVTGAWRSGRSDACPMS